MAKAFRNTRRGITGQLEAGERALIRRLFDDVITMLEPEAEQSRDPLAAMVGLDSRAEPPGDNALRRLLPDGVRGDDAEALEFRRLTERSLREEKISALRAAAMLIEGSRLLLSGSQAHTLARALNDVRLVVAERLEIKDEQDAERLHAVDDWSRAEDVESYLALVYNFVTWLQESLVQALLSRPADPGPA